MELDTGLELSTVKKPEAFAKLTLWPYGAVSPYVDLRMAEDDRGVIGGVKLRW